MKVIGIEGNVGSMLYPFQELGHEIVCNFDSRGIVSEENYLYNFPDSKLYTNLNDMYEEELVGVDIDVVVMQPSCSKFSQLSRKDREDYEECINLGYYIDKIKPKFFFIESKLDYIDEMPVIDGYKYQVEWVSNYHYGNTQKGRNRLWIMGIREDQDWKFIPNEQQHTNTVESVIADLPAVDIEHLDHVHVYKPFIKSSIDRTHLTLDEAFDMLTEHGKLFYEASDGSTKTRINRKIANKVHSTTITGGGTWFHWDKKYPLTLREKARIQGFPDEFSFQGLSNTRKDKAVGKSMPFEFTRYLAKALSGHDVMPEKKRKLVPEPVKLSMFKRIKFKSRLN